jgi:hypothetical protein
LLPVPYFHLVFTLPHELNTLVLYNIIFYATQDRPAPSFWFCFALQKRY